MKQILSLIKFPLLLILAGMAVYCNSVKNPFVWDDEYLIEKNSHIRSWEKLPEMFVSSLSLPSPKQGNFYRPFQTISFLFDYSFWKLNPVGYHVTNLLFHILNALLIYILIKMLLQNNLAFRNSNNIDSSAAPQNDKKKCHSERSEESNLTSLLAALLFLIHPVHTEAVTYISGRADPIVTSFCLMSLILFTKTLSYNDYKRQLFYLGSIISFLCALLSKEAALIFPFLLVWCGYSFRIKKNRSFLYYLPFFLLSALYVALRLTLLKSISEPHPPIAPFYSRVITFFNVILRYIGLLFFPQDLHMERRLPFLNSLFQPEAILSIVLVRILSLATI